MVKQSVMNLKIRCKNCNTEFGTVKEILGKFNNEWDADEPTEWVKKKLETNDLAVLTHYPIICTTCEPNKQIATLKLDFISRENDAELTWQI